MTTRDDCIACDDDQAMCFLRGQFLRLYSAPLFLFHAPLRLQDQSVISDGQEAKSVFVARRWWCIKNDLLTRIPCISESVFSSCYSITAVYPFELFRFRSSEGFDDCGFCYVHILLHRYLLHSGAIKLSRILLSHVTRMTAMAPTTYPPWPTMGDCPQTTDPHCARTK